MVSKHITLNRILSKLYRDLGIDNISEVDVIEWCGEALDHIGVPTIYEKRLTLFDIKNHQCNLPIGLQFIEQVARNTGDRLTPVKDNLDYNGIENQELESDNIFERNGEREVVSNSVTNQFVNLRLANSNLFRLLVLDENEAYNYGEDEYSVVDGIMRFSFKEGQVIISYYRQPLDPKTGYPMIPDVTSVVQAITSYVTYKYMQRNWYLGRQGFDNKMAKAEEDWHWYCRQAKGVMIMPKGLEGHQQLLEIQNSVLPRKYYGYFGNIFRDSNYGKDRRWT